MSPNKHEDTMGGSHKAVLPYIVLYYLVLNYVVLSKKLKSSIFDKESATKHYHRKIIKDLVAINIIASQPPEQRPTALQCGLLVLKW